MGTRYAGPPDEVRALDTYIKLMRAAQAVSVRIHEHLRHVDLTLSQFGVLEALLHLGPLSQRDLCLKLLQSGGNMTAVVQNLERRGLVARARDPENRRLVIVRLTPGGRRLVERVFPVHARIVAQDFGVLSPEEQHALGALLKRLGRGPA